MRFGVPVYEGVYLQEGDESSRGKFKPSLPMSRLPCWQGIDSSLAWNISRAISVRIRELREGERGHSWRSRSTIGVYGADGVEEIWTTE